MPTETEKPFIDRVQQRESASSQPGSMGAQQSPRPVPLPSRLLGSETGFMRGTRNLLFCGYNRFLWNSRGRWPRCSRTAKTMPVKGQLQDQGTRQATPCPQGRPSWGSAEQGLEREGPGQVSLDSSCLP